jgi:hypothetical protein
MKEIDRQRARAPGHDTVLYDMVQAQTRTFASGILLLKPHFHRCHSLAISLSAKDLATYVFPLAGDILSLRSLELRLSDYSTNLTIFSLRPDTRFVEDVRVRIKGDALPEVLDFVSCCNGLRNLSIDTLDRNLKFSDVCDKLSFPNLRSLHAHGHVITSRISTWNTPRLLHLTLEESWGGALRAPLKPIHATLRTLVILGRDSVFMMENISSMLQRQVSLVAIEIAHSHPSTYTHTLQTLSDSQDICPRLVHIRLLERYDQFLAFEPAVRVLINSRPHIRVSIELRGLHLIGPGPVMSAYNALHDLYPMNVGLVKYLWPYFPKPLYAEHDD